MHVRGERLPHQGTVHRYLAAGGELGCPLLLAVARGGRQTIEDPEQEISTCH
jgi:hypothetical protein